MNINKNLANFFNVPAQSETSKPIAGGTFDSASFQKITNMFNKILKILSTMEMLLLKVH